MFPIAPVIGGLQIASSIGGLLGSAAARKRAEAARQMALERMRSDAENQYQESIAQGMRGGAGLSGELNDVIGSTGRGLGSSLAGAGIYNSSAAAGALSNLGSEGNRAIAGYLRDIHNTASTNRLNAFSNIGRLQYGQAAGDYDTALGNYNNTLGGLSSVIGKLPAFFPQGKTAPLMPPMQSFEQPNIGVADGRNTALSGSMPYQMMPSRMASPDPVQSNIQTLTDLNRENMVAPNIRETGAYTFGNQGGKLKNLFPRRMRMGLGG